MPFDDNNVKPSKQSQRIGMKEVGTKSMFDDQPKKPTQAQFEERVKEVSQRDDDYKQRASNLTVQFNRAMADKTLPANKNVFAVDAEQELLRNMVRLAQEINTDIKEREGEGTLSWVIILLKTCFAQRDRLNQMEYGLQELNRKYEVLKAQLNDKPKNSE